MPYLSLYRLRKFENFHSIPLSQITPAIPIANIALAVTIFPFVLIFAYHLTITSLELRSSRCIMWETSDSSSSQTESQSKLLRFRVTNTDILDTCQTIYFSQPEENGLFLLTGDRSYYIDNKPYEETFYFLFTPALDDKGLFYYEVEGDIMQNAPITGSKLYPLTEKPSLIARKTGNLITLKYSAENWNLDILIDLREFH